MKVAKKVLGSKVGTAIAIALLLVLVIAAVVFLFYNKEPRLSVVSVSSLERVLEISEMKTVEYDYNAIAQVNKDKKTVKYYVSYKGTVNAGIDFILRHEARSLSSLWVKFRNSASVIKCA